MKRISPIKALAAALLIAVLLVGAGILLASCGSPDHFSRRDRLHRQRGPTKPRVPDSGQIPAPEFSGVTLDGDIVTLDQFRGKPLLLVYMTSG